MPVRYVSRYAPPPLAASPMATLPARSHAAAYASVAVLLLGVWLSSYSFLFPALLAVLLVGVGLSFLSTRVNPFSVGYYLNTKPSWTAIAAVFLTALFLASLAYADWHSGGIAGLTHWPRRLG
ncbi:MAG: hypothetical protein L3J72_04525 [Thermoplasmata archaeon]|nr:hypothetical protein [Thermoplasmata archaeon]